MIRQRKTRSTLTFKTDPSVSPNAPEIFTLSISSVLAPYADINGPDAFRGDEREELDRGVTGIIADLLEQDETDPLIAIQLLFTVNKVYVETLRLNAGSAIVGTLEESPHDVLFHLSPLMTDTALHRCERACHKHHQCWVMHGRYVVSFSGRDDLGHASSDAIRTA